jgi:SNF2 family DNA or RNA helicase
LCICRVSTDKEDFKRLLRPIFWRHSKADVADEINLPPQQEEVIRLQLSPVERTYYDRLYEDLLGNLESIREPAGEASALDDEVR